MDVSIADEAEAANQPANHNAPVGLDIAARVSEILKPLLGPSDNNGYPPWLFSGYVPGNTAGKQCIFSTGNMENGHCVSPIMQYLVGRFSLGVLRSDKLWWAHLVEIVRSQPSPFLTYTAIQSTDTFLNKLEEAKVALLEIDPEDWCWILLCDTGARKLYATGGIAVREECADMLFTQFLLGSVDKRSREYDDVVFETYEREMVQEKNRLDILDEVVRLYSKESRDISDGVAQQGKKQRRTPNASAEESESSFSLQ